ncbi:unnamed protein product [Callosobruchus maculatus]|uniref:Uncharacterized protein n=1 Tax=Callosobruchus maculatus TaxID=64391 RepID=A0A653BDC3_CALMS|nr:unnamed protein product [Callosobruchus maculatus]
MNYFIYDMLPVLMTECNFVL